LCHLANQWYIYELAKKEQFWVANKDSFASITAFITLIVMAYSLYYIVNLSSKARKALEVGA
jgi:hypothetical protein